MATATTEPTTRRHATTLIELLVAIGVIGVLASLLIPSVMAAREAARQTLCRNNLRQLGLALHNYEAAHASFPASFRTTADENANGSGASWSIHGRLLPFLEEESAASRVRLDVDWHDQVETGVTHLRLATLVCPSEPNQQIRTKNSRPYVSPHTYGFNLGSWMVYDPSINRGGDGAFVVNRDTRAADLSGGLSKVLAIAEVRAYQPYLRNTQDPGPSIPDGVAYLTGFTGQWKETGHTVWPDGRVHHSGVTTVFTPNAFVGYQIDGRVRDIDFTSQQEGKSNSRVTYAAITSRSYHAGKVNAALMDGSVRTVDDQIDLTVWRSLGSRG
ncbi:MAG: DUF1559 domain-containing protein [Planctomycetota bacterium]